MIISSVKTMRSKNSMTVSVIIPAYNEEKTVANVIKTVKSLNYIDEIIVVNDGSVDSTEQTAKRGRATVLSHTKNRGKVLPLKPVSKTRRETLYCF